ncbi:uncharacterized protein LOC144822378 isoform X1 [Lissotriton helveticus]
MDSKEGSPELLGPVLSGRPQLLGSSWLESSLTESLLPGKPWHKVLDKLGAVLADEIKEHLQEPKKRQMIFQLLGPQFVQKHFSEYPNQPSLLSSINMSRTEHRRLEQATLSMLQERCSKAAGRIRFQLSPDEDFTDMAPEMMSFVNDTCSHIETNMELHLSSCEEQQKDVEAAGDEDSSTWFSSWALLARRRPQSIESKDVHLAIRRQTVLSYGTRDTHLSSASEPKAPPVNCPGSEVLGESVCAILSSHPEHLPAVCERLAGKLLPKALRRFIWVQKLLRSDHRVLFTDSKKNSEKGAREKFGRIVQHRLAELKLRSATRSPISGLIENAVVETYENTPCLQPFASNEYMILETCKTLNVLFVYNGRYDPYLIHWLLPLQVALKQTPAVAEHPYELAMYLYFLMQNLFPSWVEIYAMAERVMSLLESEDTEFFTHLQSSFRNNVTFDPKDFLVELIAREREEAQKMIPSSDGSQQHQPLGKELLVSPVIFLRKWMGEGFVSILDLHAILLIWDQLYMQDWNRKVMENFCLAVLMLLKHSLMEAEDYPAVRQVLLFHGYHLLTADIQRAWIHLQQGGLPADIPDFNRLRSPREAPPSRQAEKVAIGFREILPVGVKNVQLTLNLPALLVPLSLGETWLSEFNPLAVKIAVSVYYDYVKLRTQTSTAKPVVIQRSTEEATNIENTLLTLQFPDSCKFDSLDPSEFTDVEDPGADAVPFIVLRILYNHMETELLTLGWVKVDSFQRDPAGIPGVWAPREFSLHFPVCPGKEPVNMIAPKADQTSEEQPLGLSLVQLSVYDPLKESAIEEEEETPSDVVLPHPNDDDWVPHSDVTLLPDPTPQDQPFDLYIDAIRYIPDSATIIKVISKVMNSGQSDCPFLKAFPVLSSLSRSPDFEYRTVINANERKPMSVNAFLIFQVSTVDLETGSLTILGNCRLGIFSDSGRLNVGGFQLRLKVGMPPNGPSSLTPSSLDAYPSVPGCSILVRLLPHTQDSVPAPSYGTGFYFSDEAKLTRSELQIISTFKKEENFPRLGVDMAKSLMDHEQRRVTGDEVETWYQDRFDIQKIPVNQRQMTYINLSQVIRYHQEIGMRARITQVYGLQIEGLYINAFARILKGHQSMDLPELPQRWGGEEKFLTRHHDFASLQRCPRWTDPSVVLHPYLDEHSVLLVQLFGMEALYKPDPSGQRPGVVVPSDGQNLQLYVKQQLGWAAVPLFEGQYVKSGIYSAPLFQGSPSPEFLQAVTSRPLTEVIAEGIKKKKLQFFNTFASLKVELWDAHYLDDECYPLPEVHDLLAAGKVSKFLKTQSNKKGAEMSQLVLQSMDKKLQKLKRNSPEYQQQESFYEEAMTNAFYNLIETALLNAGYSPL